MKNLNYYFLYSSEEAVNVLLDKNNKDHVELINHLGEMEENAAVGPVYTDRDTRKLRKLCAKVMKCHVKVSKYDYDLWFRKGRYPVIEDNWPCYNPKIKKYTCEWINLNEILKYIK